MANVTLQGNLVDIQQQNIYPAEVRIDKGKIASITQNSKLKTQNYILPGFIDAHVHIESSMLIPSEFARLAVVHGTVATVSDPHEIANVCGIKGVEFMIENGNTVPFKFNFGAPSCVPATIFETAGARLDVQDIQRLINRADIRYLSEMMNFPGVLNDDADVMEKIAAAKEVNKPVDGHAPGLIGEDARRYIAAGITTDHECFTKEEALDKLRYGMKIIIREGSAAKNFDALIDLLHDYPDRIMFCSDDKHPDSLMEGHINQLCARAVAKGIDVFKVLHAACINPVLHYNLPVGLLREGDAADLIVVKNLTTFEVLQTYVNGTLVAENKNSLIPKPELPNIEIINNFHCSKKETKDFEVRAESSPSGTGGIPVIEALDGQLITNKLAAAPIVIDGCIVSDVENDILKIAVVNRYQRAPVATAFIKNFGLKRGALASSVAHDSHNVVAVGVDDESLCRAVNAIIETKGGICCTDGQRKQVLPLPVGGLMSAEDGYLVAEEYTAINRIAKEFGCTLSAPFMTLSFMALLVIPHLKLSDLGLFDGDSFSFIR
ncbi:MAG: adenine deaminase [Flavisolibacter sp.]|nr:adenine deaminase [Flavisolibacter sp.]